MDPTNNPTPNPNPTPDAGAGATSNPVTEAGVPQIPEAPNSEPNPEPVNPVIMPGGAGANGASGAAANPMFQPNGDSMMVAATEPVMMPEPAPEPDPEEEELKAPMKAAEPVPGSIGSAVSMPEGGATPPNVAFNDPATQAEGTPTSTPNPNPMMAEQAKPEKKQQNKTVLIALIAVVAVIVVVLLVMLLMQVFGSNSGGQASGGGGIVASGEGGGSTVVGPGTLKCTRSMTEEELYEYDSVELGTVEMDVEFDSDGVLTDVKMTKSVRFVGSDGLVEVAGSEMVQDDITNDTVGIFELPLNEDGKAEHGVDAIQNNYEDLDYNCKIL